MARKSARTVIIPSTVTMTVDGIMTYTGATIEGVAAFAGLEPWIVEAIISNSLVPSPAIRNQIADVLRVSPSKILWPEHSLPEAANQDRQISSVSLDQYSRKIVPADQIKPGMLVEMECPYSRFSAETVSRAVLISDVFLDEHGGATISLLEDEVEVYISPHNPGFIIGFVPID